MRRSLPVLAVCALILAGCSDSGGADKKKALSAYNACVTRAAEKMDDGYGDAATVAKAVMPTCSAEYDALIAVNDPQKRDAFDAAMKAKQLEFTTTIVADRRKAAR